jgi:hypothetical protein
MRIPTPKMGVHLGVCEFILSHSRNANVIFGLHYWPAPFYVLPWLRAQD